jgi:hypothetical protein
LKQKNGCHRLNSLNCGKCQRVTRLDTARVKDKPLKDTTLTPRKH